MSTDLTTFAFDGADVRVVTDEAGDPRFVAKDVAHVLELATVYETPAITEAVPA